MPGRITWKPFRSVVLLILLAHYLSGSTARAQDSIEVFSFQGAVAVKPGQTPLDDDPYDARFSIYDSATGGSLLWSENQQVTIQDGLYTAELGSVQPLPLDLFTGGSDFWLEVAINLTRHPGEVASQDTFTPRIHLTMTPLADVANQAFASDFASEAGALAHANPSDQIVAQSRIVADGGGSLAVANSDGFEVGELFSFEREGALIVRDPEGRARALLSSASGDGDLLLANNNGVVVASLAVNDDHQGSLVASNTGETPVASLESNNNTGRVMVSRANGTVVGSMEVDEDEGNLLMFNRNGRERVFLSSFGGDGFLQLFDDTGLSRIVLDARNGVITGDLKSFSVDHPADPGKRIVYASLEGPEAAMYHRGTAHLAQGQATIELPEHFRLLCVPETLTVQLTPRSAQSQGLACVEATPSRLVVRELHNGTGSYDFDYSVVGVRHGHEDFEPVRQKRPDHASKHQYRLDRQPSDAKRIPGGSARLESAQERLQRFGSPPKTPFRITTPPSR